MAYYLYKTLKGVIFMKKACFFVLVTSFVCSFNSCVSLESLDYPQPAFDNPLVYIIDTSKVDGNLKYYIKLHNTSNDSNINFRVYIHNPGNQEWIVYGIGNLKGPGDTDTIDSGIKDINKYRYFAIESMNGKNYKYQLYTSLNNLHINIIDG
jgi:hypothetical protein